MVIKKIIIHIAAPFVTKHLVNKHYWLIEGDSCFLRSFYTFIKTERRFTNCLYVSCKKDDSIKKTIKPSSLKYLLLKNYVEYHIDQKLIDSLPPSNIDLNGNYNELFDYYYSHLIAKLIEKKKENHEHDPVYLIITGDDYGRNHESTIGINKCFDKKYITQTSMMVNCKDSKSELTNIASTTNTSLHFNFLEGYRTYNKEPDYFYNVNKKGIARRLVSKTSFLYLCRKDKTIIKNEIVNQISLFKTMGRKTISFDSHGNIHNKFPVAKMMIKACHKNGFLACRIPNNSNNNHALFKHTYERMMIKKYRKYFITPDYFCSVFDLLHTDLNKFGGKVIEIMTHPYFDKEVLFNRRDISFNQLFDYIGKYNCKLINYNDLVTLRKN